MCIRDREGEKSVTLFYGCEKSGLVSNADRKASPRAVTIKTLLAGNIPGQTSSTDARAETRRSVRFRPQRRCVARAVTALRFTHKRQQVIDPIASGNTVEYNVVLRIRIVRRCQNAETEIAEEIEAAEVLPRDSGRKEIHLVDADAALLIRVRELDSKTKRNRWHAPRFISQSDLRGHEEIAR